ncbi:iron ABC transporter permease [Acaryochloris sp. IP29b_bin.148]|uniref:ABC transporter permease n=1 Tax=Acaryochloris sp. IP29b_bin.148 TaxID=2969218 RepID=UPI00262F283D|nr:iron ABC transporter permease [Acaryochloris sp. IP29b_bin.148]
MWTIGVMGIAVLIATPIFVVLSSIFTNQSETWEHLATTVLPTYITNSLLLMLGVSVGVLIIGVGTAWLVTMCEFPGSRIFEWALLLPLAAPAYLLAYTYTDVFDYFGPVQTFLRDGFGWESATDYWFPNIRSLWGAIAMFSLVLYPYVYLLTRVTFLEQSICTQEASRSLGCNPWQSFVKVALPLARPAITAGLALALMETLNDFGTVQYFGVPTFTTGIYRTWFGGGEQMAATQLAAVLMMFILSLILLERWSRRQARYYQTSSPFQRLSTYKLGGGRAVLAWVSCCLPIGLGLLIPGALLVQMTLENRAETLDQQFLPLALNSLLLATLTAGLAVLLSLFLVYGLRLSGTPVMRLGVRVAAMGYAIPGSVIAVGILIPLAQVDGAIAPLLQKWFNLDSLLQGTITALIFAYLVRFLAVSLGSVESGLAKIKPSFDDAAYSLGHSARSTLAKVHAPMMGGSLLTALMLVFVDVMKELPATIVIQPPNFDTLAVRVYRYASDERLVEAAAPALAIVMVGLLPVMFLSWQIAQSRLRSTD